MKKLFAFILLISLCLTIEAQLDEGVYQGFKVMKMDKNSIPDIINIQVNKLSTAGVTSFSEEKNKPLNGRYHIIIHKYKYIIADFSKGLPHGNWTLYSYNKEAEKASFKNGKYDGEVHEYYDGHSITTLKEGVMQHHISYHPNGKLKVERFYENGRLNGEMKEYDNEGKLIREAHYLQGKRNGKYMERNLDGYTSTSNYKNDVLEGEYVELFGNGQIAQKGSYDSSGKKTGRWVRYKNDGTLIEDVGYLDGVYHGEKRSYSQGELSSVTEYEKGKNHGKHIWYYSANPKIKREEKNYVNNELEGPTKYYTDKGVLYTEILYKKGKETLTREFDRNSGTIYAESTYKDGNIIRKKIYDNKGNLKLLRLVDERGSLVDVQEYNTNGTIIKTNKNYKKPASITVREDASGIIDIE